MGSRRGGVEREIRIGWLSGTEGDCQWAISISKRFFFTAVPFNPPNYLPSSLLTTNSNKILHLLHHTSAPLNRINHDILQVLSVPENKDLLVTNATCRPQPKFNEKRSFYSQSRHLIRGRARHLSSRIMCTIRSTRASVKSARR